MSTRHWGKRAAGLICVLMLLLTGCQPLPEGRTVLETKYVAATFYPLYSLAVNIVKDVPALSLSCLTQPQDGCIRRYELSDWDYAVLMNQDAVLLGGRGLERFEAELVQATSGPILMSALEGLHLKRETAGDPDDENQAHFIGENPWLFLSVNGAMEIGISIAADMAEIDEMFAEKYAENLEDYLWRLERLADSMKSETERYKGRQIAVLHEGLSYFAESLGLEIACIYPREPGSDAVDNDLAALLEALNRSAAEAVFLEEQAPEHLVRALEEAGYPVARIDTLTAHMADGDAGAYERIMLENAQAARKTLERAGK